MSKPSLIPAKIWAEFGQSECWRELQEECEERHGRIYKEATEADDLEAVKKLRQVRMEQDLLKFMRTRIANNSNVRNHETTGSQRRRSGQRGSR